MITLTGLNDFLAEADTFYKSFILFYKHFFCKNRFSDFWREIQQNDFIMHIKNHLYYPCVLILNFLFSRIIAFFPPSFSSFSILAYYDSKFSKLFKFHFFLLCSIITLRVLLLDCLFLFQMLFQTVKWHISDQFALGNDYLYRCYVPSGDIFRIHFHQELQIW